MDEDNPEFGLSHGAGADSSHIPDSSTDDLAASSNNSALDILSIAEAHKEKSKSQQDLKRQFEEFSRNLSFRRSGSARNKKKGKGSNSLILIETDVAISEEQEDQVGRLTPVLSSVGGNNNVIGVHEDIDFPQGFSFKARPSIWPSENMSSVT